MLNGIDLSNHQGEVNAGTAACLKQRTDIVVVRASLEGMDLVRRAQRQIQACKDAGLIIHAYLWMYPSWEPEKTVADAMREYGSFDLPWWWIDAEEDQDIADPLRNAIWMHAALDALVAAGRKVGIYTAKWWWDQPKYMDGRTGFRDVPLWVAAYSDRIDLTSWPRFGGWTEAWARQYSSSGNLCGISPLDLDVFDDRVMAAPEPGPDPRDEQIAQLTASKIGLRDAYTLTTRGFRDEIAAQTTEARNREARLRAMCDKADANIAKFGA